MDGLVLQSKSWSGWHNALEDIKNVDRPRFDEFDVRLASKVVQ